MTGWRQSRWWAAGVAALAGVALIAALVLRGAHSPAEAQQGRGPSLPARRSVLRLDQIPFDGAAAYQYLKDLCALGPRPTGSDAMRKQQQLLTDHFTKLGAKVERQEFFLRHPLNGQAVAAANLIVRWHPDRTDRVLLCAHYDTRPFPDRDRQNTRGTFLGANDGASGAAVLMELGRHMPPLAGRTGVDFVLFDAEELVIDERGTYCEGARHFAQEYVDTRPAFRYRAGVLLDMVGDTSLQLPIEPNSWAEAPDVVRSVWDTAQRLGVLEFDTRQLGPKVNDDHMPLNDKAGIPTIDIIDFAYPYWHTQGDRPEHCSPLSLAKVGWVVWEWLKTEAAR